MVKIKPHFPKTFHPANTQGNNGVNGNAANQTEFRPNEKPHKPKKNSHQGKNNTGIVNTKNDLMINGSLRLNKSLIKNLKLQTNFFHFSTLQLNPAGKAFSLGLSQNLQIATLSILDSLPSTLQNTLNGFTAKEIVLGLLLNVGLNNELQSNLALQNKGQNPNLDNSALQRIFTLLSEGNNNSSPTKQINNLFNNLQNLFIDCGCATTTKDLQHIASKYSSILQLGDAKTIATLAAILKESQIQNPENAKLHTLLKHLIDEGKLLVYKQARAANVNQQKSVNDNLINQQLPNSNSQINKTSKINQAALTNTQAVLESEGKIINKEFYSEKTENALRKQLDYYPHYAYDRQISTFENPEEANLGKQEFVDKYYSEIEDWLESGKHRFVKDFDFEKPLGMIVDRSENGFITAEKMRVVLVRDGSIEGWHFLRSFLIS